MLKYARSLEKTNTQASIIEKQEMNVNKITKPGKYSNKYQDKVKKDTIRTEAEKKTASSVTSVGVCIRIQKDGTHVQHSEKTATSANFPTILQNAAEIVKRLTKYKMRERPPSPLGTIHPTINTYIKWVK